MRNEMAETDRKKSLGINFIFNFISQILTLAIPLITAPYLARVLHETGNGQYSYSCSIITYFVLFANLGFDIYGQRQVAAHNNNKELISKVFWEIFVIKCLTTIVSLTVLITLLYTVGFGDNYNKLILILSIQVLAVPFDIQFLFRGQENFAAIAIRSIITKVIGLICVFCFVKQESDLWIYTLCMSLTVVGSNLIMWFSLKKNIFLINIHELKIFRHLKPAILIFLPTLAVTIYSVFDKTMIGILSENPDYENGCYEQAYKLNSIMLLLVTIISPVLVSRNSNDYSKNGIEEIRNNLYFACNYVFIIGTPLIVGNFVLSKNLCSWFLGDGYEEVPKLLNIMSIRFILSGFGEVFGNQLFIAIGKEKYPMIATFIAAFLNVGLNALLIPHIGAIGAAITTAISEAIVTVILILFVVKGKYLSIKKICAMVWKYLISAAIMFVPIYFMDKCLGYTIWSFILIAVSGGCVYGLVLLVLKDKFMLNLLKAGIGKIKFIFSIINKKRN